MTSRSHSVGSSPTVWLVVCIGSVLVAASWWNTFRKQQNEDEAAPRSILIQREDQIASWVDQGKEAISELRQLLREGEIREKRDATSAIIRLGPIVAELVPDLLPQLESSDSILRELTILALIAIDANTESLLPRIALGLTDKAREVRTAAARALQGAPDDLILKLASQTGPASQFLNVERVRRQIDVSDEDIEILRRFLANTDADEFLRADCFEMLIWHECVRLEDLLIAIRSNGIDLNALGVRYLEVVGPAAAAAAPDLINMLNAQTASTHMAALKALSSLGPVAKTSLADLEDYLHSERCVDVAAAAQLVVALGGDKKRVAERLRGRILGDVPGHAFAPTLMSFDRPAADAIVLELVSRLESDPSSAREVLDNLRHFHDAAQPAVPAIRKLIVQRKSGLLRDALAVLEAAGRGAESALPEIRELYDEIVQRKPGSEGGSMLHLELACLQILGNIGAGARGSVPQLIERFQRFEFDTVAVGVDKRIDLHILETLGKMSSDDAEVQEFLKSVASPTENGPQDRAGYAAHALLNTDEPPLAFLDLARGLLVISFDSSIRLRLIDELAKKSSNDVATLNALVQIVESDDIPLGDRLVALESLSQIGPKAEAVLDRLQAILARPRPRFPGPSRAATEGTLYGDRYKPAVRERLAIRRWIVHTIDQIRPTTK